MLPELPSKPGGGEWAGHARETWGAWREDPGTAQLTGADVAFLIDTLHLVDRCSREPQASLAAEIRIRLDTLGLTPKGRQDRRWRLVAEQQPPPPTDLNERRLAQRRRLMADPITNGDAPA